MATVRMRPSSMSGEDLLQPVEVHGFVQTIVDGLVDQRMIGDADRPGEILGAGHLIGENGGEQIVGAHALDRRGYARSAAESQNGERPRCIPAPARAEHGSGQQRLPQARLPLLPI